MGLPMAAIYRVCQCVETRKPAKRKAERGRQAVQIPEKRGTSSSRPSRTRRESPQWNGLKRWMLTGPLSTELWGSLLLGHWQESDGLSLGQSWNRGKTGIVERTRGRNAHFEPRLRRDGPSCCPVTSSYRGFLGCPQAGGWQGSLGPKNEQILRRRIGKCVNDLDWDVVRSMILAAETNVRMVADTYLLELQWTINAQYV